MRSNSTEMERELIKSIFEIAYPIRPQRHSYFVDNTSTKNKVRAPDRVVFNGPATIAFWPDGTKTIVKCQDNEPFDPEKGVAMAILKKVFGGGRYNDIIKRLIDNATAEKKG